MAKPTDPNLKCSFCGKTQDQVKKLIAGPDVCICDECIELCNEILDEDVVPKAEYLRILDSFRKKYKILQDIFEGDYFYVLRSNGVTYYWIPVDLLP